AESPDRIRLQPDLHRVARALLAQVGKETPLHDAELSLSRIGDGNILNDAVAERQEPIAGAACPAQRPLHRRARDPTTLRRLRMREALVEDHGNVRPEL